jgi:excinuclease ABC subunit A
MRRSVLPSRSKRRSAWRKAQPVWRSTTHRARAAAVLESVTPCTICGYSLTGLEPRLFSFNNPNGACGTCGGLGVQEYFDPGARRRESRPVAGRRCAIRGWDRRNAYYFQLIQSLARHFASTSKRRGSSCPNPCATRCCGAAARKKSSSVISMPRVRSRSARTPGKGILPNLERRYRETESNTVREELGQVRGMRPCVDCHGSRLNQAARHVFVAGRPLPEIAAMSDRRSTTIFASMSIEGWRGEIAARIVTEVADRLKFLSDVGLDYLSLDRSAETLSGGEAQRIRLASQIGSGSRRRDVHPR